jgi:crossover junction endodeoxyribonuclease RuvC
VLVLGIDPGTRVTGFGAVRRENGRYLCVERGAVRPKASAPLADRLLHLHDELDSIARRVAPDIVAVEDCFYAKNIKSTLKIGHVKGLVLVVAARHGLEVAEYSPRRVKQSVCGQGGATKEQVQFMVKRMVTDPNGEVESLDVTDAIAVALCHHHLGTGASQTLNALKVKS